MQRTATAILGLALAFLVTVPATAQVQDVTIDQLNAVPQANIDALNALGPDASLGDIQALLTNDFIENGTEVRITAVVISDPRYSGLATPNAGVPGRLHYFIRDTAAETEGPEGMTMQIVDDTDISQALGRRPGDVIEVEGQLTVFPAGGSTWQLDPSSVTLLDVVDPTQEWLQPVTVTTDDINTVVDDTGADPLVQANWDNWNSLNGQYVRVESAVMTNSAQGDRPNWAFASAGEARVSAYDLSLRYRNDRCDDPAPADCYPNPPYFTRAADDPFIPPPTSAVVAVQGFLIHQTDDPFTVSSPQGAGFNLIPITDEDLQVLESPPVIALERPDFIPTDDFEVAATVIPGGAAELASVTLNYEFSTGETGSVAMTEDGVDTYVGTIPVEEAQDGAFVTFSVTATDGNDLTSTSDEEFTRVLLDGIDDIEDVQLTPGGSEGESPFNGVMTDMDIEAVVMSDPTTSGILSVQDNEDLDPWTGIFVEYTDEIAALGLQPGDRVTITSATINDPIVFGAPTATTLEEATLSVTGGGDPYDYKVVPTGVLAQDNATAEAHEGMALRFNGVSIISADEGFGEWSFATDGVEANAILADDLSSEVPGGDELFTDGQELEFIQGLWYFSFGDFKLLPEDLDDIGLTLDAEGGAAPAAFSFGGVYPNPFRASATVLYSLRDAGEVELAVYDVMGRKVATLVDGMQPAGPNSADLRAAGLASGVYFARLSAGGDAVTTKFVITQ